MITGGAAYAWGAAELAGRAGKTPAQRDRPTALVTTGLFQYSRNPMYLGVILIFLGDLVFFETLVYLFYALGVWGLFHLFVVYYEEPRLGREFGESYRNYTSRVPRWLPFGLLNP